MKLYRELATVDAHADVDVSLDALRLTPPEPRELDALYRELEFYSLLSGGAAEAKAGDTPPVPVEIPATVEAARRRHRRAAPRAGRGAGPALRAGRAHPPRPARRARRRGRGARAALPGLSRRGRGRHALGDAAVELAARASSRDERPPQARPRREGAAASSARGTGSRSAATCSTPCIASFLVDPAKCIPHGLDQVAKEYVQRGVPSLKSLLGSRAVRARSERPPRRARPPPTPAQLADVVLALGPGAARRASRTAGQRAHYEAVEHPLAYVLARMELAGIRVDKDGPGAHGRRVPRPQGGDRDAHLRAGRPRVQHRIDQAARRRALRGAEACR